MDLRSWLRSWNATAMWRIGALPEGPPSRQWPLVGMFALGLAAGAALGGYVVSQRAQLRQLASHAHRISGELAAMGRVEAVEPISAVTSARINHRRKVASEV